MNLSRIWGVGGSQCCCFQQFVGNNIKCVWLPAPGPRMYLWKEKTFKKENLVHFCSIFLVFSVTWRRKNTFYLSAGHIVPEVRRYLSGFWGALMMPLNIFNYLSDGRAPLVEVLGGFFVQKTWSKLQYPKS